MTRMDLVLRSESYNNSNKIYINKSTYNLGIHDAAMVAISAVGSRILRHGSILLA